MVESFLLAVAALGIFIAVGVVAVDVLHYFTCDCGVGMFFRRPCR